MRRAIACVLPTIFVACGDSTVPSDRVTRPGWAPAEVLAEEAVFDSSLGVSLSGDGAGGAVAVWAPSTVPYAPVLARRFTARDGWMAVETVESGGSSSVNTPTVRMNRRGDAVAIWDTYYGLTASTRPAGGAWDDAVRIGRSGPWSWGLDDGGNALVTWTSGSRLLTSRFEPGLGWRGLGGLPGADEVAVGETPALAVSGRGLALAAWPTRDGEVRAIWFDPRLGWGTPRRLSLEPASVLLVNAFVNEAGHGIVTWYQYDPSVAGSGVLYASLLQEETGLLPAQSLGPSAGGAIAASIHPQGGALVIYMSGLGLRAQRYVAGQGWQGPEALEGVGGFDAITLDDESNGWVLWQERSASNPETGSLRSRRLMAGRAAGPVEEIAPRFRGTAWFRGTTMDTKGGLSAAWFQRTSEPGEAERYAFLAGRYDP